MRIFDSHAHYDDPRFEGGEIELLNRIHAEENVRLVCNIAADLNSCLTSMKLADDLEFVYFSVGVHPESVNPELLSSGWISQLEELSKHEKCVAVGEIGLDYYYEQETAEIQKQAFREQMRLAKKVSKPVVVHNRAAHSDSLKIVSEFPDVKGVFHCFSGSLETAKILLESGWYLSFNGVITFNNARKTVEVLKGVAEYKDGLFMDRLLVETDAPYLAPVPMRGKVNNSSYIAYTAQKASEIIGITPDEFCELTYCNACKFYGLEKLI